MSLKEHVLDIVKNTNLFETHLQRSDNERENLNDEMIAQVTQIHRNYKPSSRIPRHSTPLTEEKLSMKFFLITFLGDNAISARDIPKLEELPAFSGEGEYGHIEFIRTIDMFQEYFYIHYEMIVGKLNSLFTRTAKKCYYKMGQEHGKHDWLWWKSKIITNWDNNSWRFKMDNAFEGAIYNSEKDKKLTFFLKQKVRLSALHPDMSDSMLDMKTLRRCGVELENYIKCIYVKPCSTEDHINAMEDIITRSRIG
ncbi:hypothetical protein O181_007473 [Austropuccinia psidii MF-1]|uniref:Uncharacterized protein n=1 Tax=Austropuccinia psidii MF-1 TaxID=1389203 RepID=A0A9Q3BMH8_9BASI|nr:hypothetical protein [Austropuccinia psidii MF-1]